MCRRDVWPAREKTRPGYAGGMAASTDRGSGAVDLTSIETAGFGRRFAALLIDWALCTVVAALLVGAA